MMSLGPEPLMAILEIRLPLKIKIFLWQAFRGRLPSADQIHKRNGPGSQFCALCGELEDTEHIFFHCALAKLIWSCVREWLHVTWAPASFSELRTLASNLSGVSRRIFGWAWVLCAGPFGRLGTSLPLNMCFRLNLLIAYLNHVLSCSNGNH